MVSIYRRLFVKPRFIFRLRTQTFYTVKTELPPLVSGEWLNTQLERENVKIVDGSFHLPSANRNAGKEFSQQRIPGATFFDVNEIRNKKSPFPRMMPSTQDFEIHMSQIGLKKSDIIVIYDTVGIFSSPRAWFMLRAFGAENVCVLDGGFPLWRKEGRPIEEGPMTGAYQSETKAFSAKLSRGCIADVRNIQRFLIGVEGEDLQVIDARSESRFLGREDEGLNVKKGHIPGSISLHYKLLLNNDGCTLRSADDLKRIFFDSKVDISKPMITTCGSGVSAAMINFALSVVQWESMVDGELDEMSDDLQPMQLYDGSWAEWGRLPQSAVANEGVWDDSTGEKDVEYTRGPLDEEKGKK